MKKADSTPPAWQLIRWSEALARMPEMRDIRKQAEDDYEDEDEEDDEDDDNSGAYDPEVVYFDGDTTLSEDGWRAIREQVQGRAVLAVNGKLVFEGRFAPDGCIRGDLHCDALHGPDELLVGGTVYARHYAYFSAEDHEAIKHGYPMRVQAPIVFAWFHDVAQLELAPGTVLDILCGYHNYKKMRIEGPHFFWNDSLFALKPELCYAADSDYSDAPYWHIDAIRACSARGESLFIAGFDSASLPLRMQADDFIRAGDLAQAFAHYRQAFLRSPAWYPAWCGAGMALFHAGAYAQAIPFFQKAIACFPPRHKNIENRAADHAALCAVRLRRLELAVELAGFSIECTQNNRFDEEKRYLPFRVRGEARMLQGDWEAARADLAQAASWGWDKPAVNWLLGRVHHHSGEHKQAGKYQGMAMKKNAQRYAADYASNDSADFAYPAPAAVDWEGSDL